MFAKSAEVEFGKDGGSCGCIGVSLAAFRIAKPDGCELKALFWFGVSKFERQLLRERLEAPTKDEYS